MSNIYSKVIVNRGWPALVLRSGSKIDGNRTAPWDSGLRSKPGTALLGRPDLLNRTVHKTTVQLERTSTGMEIGVRVKAPWWSRQRYCGKEAALGTRCWWNRHCLLSP